ncbi:MAG: 60S ribosomal protein L31 [Nitrososphaerales archaeon]|nr:60S ribosomal protein L31 [Nitrososphaerales archaeon]
MSKEEEISRIYVIPLRRAWLAPKHRRAIRAINLVKEFAERHMKGSEVKIDTSLNELIWSRGIKNPPRKITVKMVKDKDGVVTVSLPSEKA